MLSILVMLWPQIFNQHTLMCFHKYTQLLRDGRHTAINRILRVQSLSKNNDKREKNIHELPQSTLTKRPK